jgi:large subunit ribosomal protein L24
MAGLKKGDTVTVLGGKDKGKTGKVLQIFPTQQRALVERINLVKHFERRTQQRPTGGIVEREATLALSTLGLMCARCHRPARVGWVEAADGKKQRICTRCRESL